ncbi:AGC family protein kinase [Tritrichomonas foetus]|uniref:AGC family protein kinase n=1 Tax=Tritrichomonas foetus TaxID=1144522 RepID=A0A1J4JJ30_9EUKA|nr:AGC family protein kinase [Tritrichomonas foetus]|eukprot:OHS98359.1 AGC family protein kinase [Tritrichomonas foetus]
MHSICDYALISCIGNGAHSKVYVGYHKLVPKVLLAIKIIMRENIAQYEIASNEIDTLKDIRHPYVTRFIDSIETDEFLAIVTEFAPNGQIDSFYQTFSEVNVYKYFYQIAKALEYLHTVKKVVHRDIKIENILLDESMNVKLIDFGFSRKIINEMTTRCGSPIYASPELVMGQKYTEKTDVWSLGVLIYYLVVGQYPFISDNLMVLFKKITKEPLMFPSNVPLSDEFKDLIKGMLDKDQNTRLTITDALNHPWFQKIGPISDYKVKRVNSEYLQIEIPDSALVDFGIPENVVLSLDNSKKDVIKTILTLRQDQIMCMHLSKVSTAINKKAVSRKSHHAIQKAAILALNPNVSFVKPRNNSKPNIVIVSPSLISKHHAMAVHPMIKDKI